MQPVGMRSIGRRGEGKEGCPAQLLVQGSSADARLSKAWVRGEPCRTEHATLHTATCTCCAGLKHLPELQPQRPLACSSQIDGGHVWQDHASRG